MCHFSESINAGFFMEFSTLNPRLKNSILLAIPIIAGLALIYRPTWEWMYYRWTLPDSYSSHGFLIPLISGWIIWQERHKFKNLKIHGSWLGLLILAIALLLHIASGITRIHFTSGISFVIAIFGLVLFILGKEGLKGSAFAIFYLFFMVPFPSFWESQFTLELKLIAAEAAARMLDFAGYIVIREGSIILFPHTQLIVGDVCSGLRSLVSLIALGVPFVYFISASWWRKGLMLLSLFPVAMFCNILRILVLGLATYYWGSEVASGFIHDASGIMIFVGDLTLLWGVYLLLKEEDKEPAKTEETAFVLDWKNIPVYKPFWWKYLVATVMIAGTAFLSLGYLYKPLPSDNTSVTASFPTVIDKWKVAQDFEPDKRTIQLLETSDIMMRYYRKDNEIPILLSIVASANSNRKIAHPPEICYKGLGWEMMKREKIRFGDNREGIYMVLFTGRTKEAVLYWYKFEKQYTAEYYTHQASALINFFRKHKGGLALIRMSMTIKDSPEDSLKQMIEFSKYVYPLLDKHLP